jgi:hypothetical protein
MLRDAIQNEETLAAPITTTQTLCYSSKTACSVNIARLWQTMIKWSGLIQMPTEMLKSRYALNRPIFTGGQNSRRIARYGTCIKEEDFEAIFT